MVGGRGGDEHTFKKIKMYFELEEFLLHSFRRKLVGKLLNRECFLRVDTLLISPSLSVVVV